MNLRSMLYICGPLGFLFGITSVSAFPIRAITIFNDPVAPPILGQDGDGFCVISQRVQYYDEPSNQQTWDAGSIFGNEGYLTSPKIPFFSMDMLKYYFPFRATPNNQTEGLQFPRNFNSFFDYRFAPEFVHDTRPPPAPRFSFAKFNQLFDLSERPPGSTDPNGDYVYTPPFAPGCDATGCKFPTNFARPDYNDENPAPANSYKDARLKLVYPEATPQDPFRDRGFRFRGFINIQPPLINKMIVFGVYGDDSVALNISDILEKHVLISGTSNRCEMCINITDKCHSTDATGRPLQCQTNTYTETSLSCGGCNPAFTGQRWRITNWVKFTKAGLYPIEILYAQFAGSAALEVSMKIIDKLDPLIGVPEIHENWGYPRDGKPSDETYSIFSANSLKDKGFTILDPAKWIFSSTTGIPQDCNLNQCIYFTNEFPPPNQCGNGKFCNEAGVCEPCDAKNACGAACVKCREDAPVCGDVGGQYQCVQCNKNADCAASQTCESDHKCHCKENANCPKGELCQGSTCVRGLTSDSCAGNSGLCCQGGTKCMVTDPTKPNAPSCVQCVTIKDCTDKFPNDNKTCDPINHQCVDQIPEGNDNTRCGPNKVACPKERPFCFEGRVCIQCKSDLDCGDGLFCRGGNCGPCTEDKKCGYTCHKCPADKPFCDGRQGAEFAKCVGCLSNSDCGQNGTCNPNTGTCTNMCTVTCAPNQYCKGDRCVECLSSAQCKGCGQFCDLDTNTCQGGNVGTGTGTGGGGDGTGRGGLCSSTVDCLPTDCCINQRCVPGPCSPKTTVNGGALCCNATNPFSTSTSSKALLFFSGLLFLSGVLLVFLSHIRRRRR